MMYRYKPIEAITFDELAEHGRKQGATCHGPLNIPWSFNYQGLPVTHETDDIYLVSNLDRTTLRFHRGDMLITGLQGDLFSMSAEFFGKQYEPVA